MVAEGTYPDRYDSAEALEYPLQWSMHGRPASARLTDAGMGRLGMPRRSLRRILGQVLVDQESWSPSTVVAHNMPAMIPLVSSRHHAVLHAHNTLLRTYSRREAGRVLAPASRIVCVSDWLAETTRRSLPVDLRSRVVVVPNGVDARAFDPSARPPRRHKLRVGFVGRMLPSKGPLTLVEAATRLDRTDLEITLVGSMGFDARAPLTEYELDLRRVASRHSVPMTFLPFQERARVWRLFSEFDVCVVPSIEPEAFGLVALEAMAAGAAVVASDVGGLPEAVGDSAVLVPPGDVGALAEVLDELADDRDVVARLAQRGRRRAEQFDWSVISGVYERALT